MIKRLVMFVLVALANAFALAHSGDSKPAASESEKIVRTEFDRSKPGRGLLIQKRGRVSTAEVCFDRCDYYEWKGSIHNEVAWHFILLYEYKEGFGSGAESFRVSSADLIRSLVKQYDKYCSPTGKEGQFTCDWAKLAEAASMKVGISTYDEGQRCFAWRDLVSMAWPSKSKCSAIKKSPWN
jgi:hypothetical protein